MLILYASFPIFFAQNQVIIALPRAQDDSVSNRLLPASMHLFRRPPQVCRICRRRGEDCGCEELPAAGSWDEGNGVWATLLRYVNLYRRWAAVAAAAAASPSGAEAAELKEIR